MNPANLRKAVEISEEIDDLNRDITGLKDLWKKMVGGTLRSSFRVELINDCNYTFTHQEIEALFKCKEDRVSELTEKLKEL